MLPTPESLLECELHKLHLPKGSIIYKQGQHAKGFYAIQNGLVGLWHMLENGKESLVRIYNSDEYFGFRTLFSSNNYHCTARVLRDAEIVEIRPHSAEHFLATNVELSQTLIRQLATELQDAEQRLSQISYQKTQERIASTIHYLTHHYPDYHWTHREIAEFSGCETETAIRVSRELKKQGIIK